MFPSPCGEKVGINGEVGYLPIKGFTIKFPSPCGEKVGINWNLLQKRAPFRQPHVSVPLRGKGRDQRERAAPGGAPAPSVSVPLRGKGRDQRVWGPSTVVLARVSVSVPLRGKGRDQQQKAQVRAAKAAYRAFPSPCGEKVGINTYKGVVVHRSANKSHVSVPLRGKGRDQPAEMHGPSTRRAGWCFRPLAGKR